MSSLTYSAFQSITTVLKCFKATIVPVPSKSSVSCLNDYWPVALTQIIIKCFKKLVMRHIKTMLSPSLDTWQFTYCPNQSTDDAITTTTHLALNPSKQESLNGVHRLSSAPDGKAELAGPEHFQLQLDPGFPNRETSVSPDQEGGNTSSTTTLITEATQGCVLNQPLFTLLTHDWVAMHSSNHIINFTDDILLSLCVYARH